jgi:hypothetical protein
MHCEIFLFTAHSLQYRRLQHAITPFFLFNTVNLHHQLLIPIMLPAVNCTHVCVHAHVRAHKRAGIYGCKSHKYQTFQLQQTKTSVNFEQTPLLANAPSTSQTEVYAK